MPPRQILMFSYGYLPHNSPAALRVAKFAKYLAKLGWASSVIAAQDGYTSRSGELSEPELHNTSVIRIDEGIIGRLKRSHATSSSQSNKKVSPSLAGRLAKVGQKLLIPDRDVFWAFKAYLHANRNFNTIAPSVIYSTSPTPSAHLAASALARSHGLPHVAEFRDLWRASALYAHGPIRGALEGRLERWVLTYAAAVIVVSPGMRDVLAAAYPEFASKIRIVYNGYDPADFDTSSSAALSGPFRLLYAGSFYDGRRDPSALLRAIQRLKQEGAICHNAFKFEIYGPSDRAVQAKVLELGLGDVVHFLPTVSYRKLTQELQTADLLVVITFSTYEGKLELTTKFFDYLGTKSNIMVLAPDAFDLATVADQLRLTRFHPSAEEAIKDHLGQRLLEMAGNRKKKFSTSGNDGREEFTREMQTRRLAAVLEEVIQ